MISFLTWIRRRPAKTLGLGSFSLRAKLLGGFAGVLALTVVVSVVSFVFQRNTLESFHNVTQVKVKIAELAASSSVAMLVARRNEKDFLLRYKEYGVREAKSRYLTQVRIAVAQIHQNMEEIRRLKPDADAKATTSRIEEVMRQYESGLQQVIRLHEKLGYAQSGLEEAFLAKARALEDRVRKLENQRLLADLLELRRQEKDFLLRGLDVDRREFASAAAKFEQNLSRADVPRAAKIALGALALSYFDLFAQYTRIESEIESTSEGYLQAAHVVEPLLEALRVREQQEMEDTRLLAEKFGHIAQVTVLAAGLGALVLGLLVAALFFKNITGMVRRCMVFAQQVASGKLDAGIDHPGADEFSQLAVALNSMTAALRSAHEAQVARQKELQLANQALEHEITEKRRAEAGLQETNAALQAVIESSPLAIITVGRGGSVETWNRAAESIFGWTAEETIGRPLPYALPGREDELAECVKLSFAGRTQAGVETQRMHKDGSVKDVNLWLSPLRAAGGEVSRVLGVLVDITERKRIERNLEYLAQYDPLTGLANRALFIDRLKLALVRAKRHRQKTALLFLDLDRFKEINDTLGHTAGDEVLKAVTERLKNTLRESDTIGRPCGNLARLGGDEFTIVLEEIARPEDIATVSERVVAAFCEPLSIEGREIFITCSIGIAVYPEDGTTDEELLRNADVAMYQAKKDGKNVFRSYARDMNSQAAEHMKLEADLRRALERREFVLHFQPKYQGSNRNIIGAEALIRWRRPEGELVPPGKFIPLLEKTGLIVPVGLWVIREACTQAKAWQGMGSGELPVAVNLSPRQFKQKDIVESIAAILHETGLRPGLLELELTESMLAQPDEALATLDALHELGVKLSVDDFGTGYSSLAYIKRFPLDKLKIDQSFVRDISRNEDDAAIVRAVVALAKSLGLAVVAEGVETPDQFRFLEGLGCDEYQGYFFAKPMPLEEFTKSISAAASLRHLVLMAGS